MSCMTLGVSYVCEFRAIILMLFICVNADAIIEIPSTGSSTSGCDAHRFAFIFYRLKRNLHFKWYFFGYVFEICTASRMPTAAVAERQPSAMWLCSLSTPCAGTLWTQRQMVNCEVNTTLC